MTNVHLERIAAVNSESRDRYIIVFECAFHIVSLCAGANVSNLVSVSCLAGKR